MSIYIMQYVKKARTLFINLIGWSSLFLIWYKLMFDHDSIPRTFHAMIIFLLFSLLLLIFYFLWNNFNFEDLNFHSELDSNFIRIKVKEWTWSEITFDINNQIIDNKERFNMICRLKENKFTPVRMQSYCALLIRDGHVKEAIGFLRLMISDPYIGQLARKIAENQLNLIYEDGDIMNTLKGCSLTNKTNNNTNVQFPMSIFGYNKKQVNEFLNELLTYNWNLEEENKNLKADLSNINNKTQPNYSSNLSNAKWEEKEFSLLLGLTLQEDILDYKGNIICNKNTIITTQLIDNLITKGLYGELVAASDPSKGVERFAR